MSTRNETPVWNRTHSIVVAGLLLAQFIVAYLIGAGQWFANVEPTVFPPIAVTAVIPVALFLVAYAVSRRFRELVLSLDIRTLTMMQHWRVVGLGFLLLYAHGVLPALFAWPAGVGDVAIGLTAFLVVTRIDRNPGYVTTSGFVWFNLMGLLDFTVAVVTAGLAGGALPGLTPDGLTSAAMDVWPLNIFPSFIVPAFIILHLMVLLKVRALRLANRMQGQTLPQAA